jgi:hypothetical protein
MRQQARRPSPVDRHEQTGENKGIDIDDPGGSVVLLGKKLALANRGRAKPRSTVLSTEMKSSTGYQQHEGGPLAGVRLPAAAGGAE